MRRFGWFSLLILVLSAVPAFAGMLDRCNDLASDVRANHWREFGIDYPWEYAVAQLAQESACRNRISLDGVGSEGVPQITYRVWADRLSGVGIKHLQTIDNQLRAQAVINRDMWSAARRAGAPRLWASFQAYNGGPLVFKEIKRAGSLRHESWRQACQRKDVRVSPTQTRNACDINGEYSVNIDALARKYWAVQPSEKFPFW